jgi:GNAT superfamily N-acetyltransferase
MNFQGLLHSSCTPLAVHLSGSAHCEGECPELIWVQSPGKRPLPEPSALALQSISFLSPAIMSFSNLRLNIRNARSEDFEIIGKLHASASASSQTYNTLFADVDPDVARQWYWIDTAGNAVAQGKDTVLVLELDDTKEIIGVAWFWRFSQGRKPELPGRWPEGAPEGFNDEEYLKLAVPRFEWQEELLKKYGEYICAHLPPVVSAIFASFLTTKYQTDLQEFAIAPVYQSQGVGKVLLRHVVALAERDRMSLALTAGHGELPCKLFNHNLFINLLSIQRNRASTRSVVSKQSATP